MKRLWLVLAAFGLIAPFAAGLYVYESAALSETIVLRHVAVMDDRHGVFRDDMVVVIAAGRISFLSPDTQAIIPEGARVIEGRGRYLIPGLWDMHIHLQGNESFLPLLLANGVLGVREMGCTEEQFEIMRRWRTDMERDSMLPLQIRASGPPLDGVRPIPPELRTTVSAPDEAASAAAHLQSLKVDFFKVHDWISRKTYEALALEASRRRLVLVGHIPAAVPALLASRLGQRSVEHNGGILGSLLLNCSRREGIMRRSLLQAMEEANRTKQGYAPYLLAMRSKMRRTILDTISEEKTRILIETFRKNRTWMCPTLIASTPAIPDSEMSARMAYVPSSLRKAWESWSTAGFLNPEDIAASRDFSKRMEELLLRMHTRGIPVLAGTDTTWDEETPYLVPGFSLHDELRLLVAAGLSPLEALRSATRNAAEFFGESELWGTVAPGMRADLVLLDADPLEDIGNTQRIAGVFSGGRFFDREQLHALLDTVARQNE